jgi:hypothetical protein
MNLIKRYIVLLSVTTLLAFSYSIITTKIELETLMNWSLFLAPSLLAFNILAFIAILSETVSLLKDIATLDFYQVFLPLDIENKVYTPLIKLIIEIKPNHLRSVVSRC